MSAEIEVIDWGLAERVARLIAGQGSGKRSVRRPDLQRASRGTMRSAFACDKSQRTAGPSGPHSTDTTSRASIQ